MRKFHSTRLCAAMACGRNCKHYSTGLRLIQMPNFS
jgi:hypothetical protein